MPNAAATSGPLPRHCTPQETNWDLGCHNPERTCIGDRTAPTANANSARNILSSSTELRPRPGRRQHRRNFDLGQAAASADGRAAWLLEKDAFRRGLTPRGFIALWGFDGPINGDVSKTRSPIIPIRLRARKLVVIDNLSRDKGPAVRETIKAAGAALSICPVAPNLARSK